MFSVASEWIVFVLVGAVFCIVVYLAIASRKAETRQKSKDKK